MTCVSSLNTKLPELGDYANLMSVGVLRCEQVHTDGRVPNFCCFIITPLDLSPSRRKTLLSVSSGQANIFVLIEIYVVVENIV